LFQQGGIIGKGIHAHRSFHKNRIRTFHRFVNT
jgi:hypothetical protein